MKIAVEQEEYELLQLMADFSSGLMVLLDRIEMENDATLASERFDLAESMGMEIKIDYIEPSMELH